MKRRILYITTDLHGGGAEYMLLHLLSGLDREQFDPLVISLMDRGKVGDAIETLGVPVKTVDMKQGRPTLGAACKLMQLIRAAQPDLIQGWMYHSNLAAQLASGFVRRPVCWCIHNSFESFAAEKPLTRLTIRLSARMSRLAAKIVFVSHASRVQHEQLGFAADRSCVIPNGIDLALFQPSDEARRAIREELGLRPDALLVGLMARYHPQKDHANFLRAAGLLARARNNVHFILAGEGVHAGNETLRELASVPELDGRIHMIGSRDDMPRLTAALDIASLSSAYGEALSLAMIEAMSSAVPCVVTDVGDNPRLVAETGEIVPPRDPVALAQGWTQLIDAGEERRRELGQSARRRVEEHYSLRSCVRRYQELYHSLS